METTIQPLTQERMAALMKYVRNCTERFFYPETAPMPIEDMPNPYEKLNVTMRIEGKVRASMSGAGDTLLEALKNAVSKCLYDNRFGSAPVMYEFDKINLELWLQVDKELLDNDTLETVAKTFKFGVDGLELNYSWLSAYFKPSVAVTSEVEDLEKLLQKLSIKAGLTNASWCFPQTQLYRTTWLHYVETINDEQERVAEQLITLRPNVMRPANAESILLSAERAGTHLARLQQSNGRYNYLYNPFKHQMDNANYNTVRMAGTTYSMSWLASATEDAALKKVYTESADRAIRFLLKHLIPAQAPLAGSYIKEFSAKEAVPEGKLGTAALALMALQYGEFREKYAEARKQLTDFICSMQEADTGYFHCFVIKRHDPDAGQSFYPGEALLALVHEFKHSGDANLQKVIARSFEHYKARFLKAPDTAFILWQADVWSTFDLLTNTDFNEKTAYADFAFHMTDWILEQQYTEKDSPNEMYIGGFPKGKLPRYSTSTYIEAVVRAYGLAVKYGETERAVRYKTACLHAFRFLISLQAQPEQSLMFPKPELAIGGVTKNLQSFEMRSDISQHQITAFLAALETETLMD